MAAAILRTTYQQTIAQARTSLEVGDRVLDQLMSLRANQLLATVDVLSSDFGFKSAVATHDGPTLRTVLANFGDRVKADVAMLAAPNGHVTSALPGNIDEDTSAFRDLLAKARKNGRAAGLVMTGNRPYQLVLAPVKAPRLIAWVGMGFAVNQQLARRLGELTGLDVQFVVFEHDEPIYRTDTAAGENVAAATGAPRDNFLSSEHVMLDTGTTQLRVVLSLARADVLAAYYKLARSLLLIFVVTLVLSALVAIWLARNLSQPVRDLSEFAQSVAAGEYRQAPQSRSIGEFDVLADALNNMQAAVRQRENRIRHQATHDALTDLPNRESIRDVLHAYFERDRPFAAARIGIHGFARINSALGYQLGDEVLKRVAQRLRAAIAETSAIGRVEGNDFLLLMQTDSSEQALRQRLELIRTQVQMPIHILTTPVSIVLEIGVVVAPRLAADVESIWRRSVIARNHSRADHARTSFYQAGMDETRMRELTIIQDLAPALEKNALDIAYQPKMVLETGAVRQVEALSRWTHPKLGAIGPDEFIGLAERSGQINLLTQWLVSSLTRQIGDWRKQGMTLGVAVNLSADELADESLEQMINPLLAAAGSPSDITLEVTESSLLRDPAAAMENLRRLQVRGARVAVDDFGTGYSSLSQLKQLSANELKIDKSLVLNLATTPADQFIVRTIIDLGHKLGLEVVAEGIENETTWQYLVQHGADLMQGYFLARPMSAEALPEWVYNHQLKQSRWSAQTILGAGGQSP
ncbi:putative bifunctional diguanylate cyclase/phosphodiesterase [Salinisphaera aquimarina]|uniref:Bifunctional diguanylate cyclase/phosphodiesterase n=1 Tax=Salinisphaera aquimarina TaxID=2094031 RepID=A0ABV7EKW5_9GAMM